MFLPARYVWIKLETFADTRKVVRAIIFTMQYIKPTECHQLVKDFSKFIEERSSVVRSYFLTPILSDFELLNDATLIMQNLLVSLEIKTKELSLTSVTF